jgi:hypothetical protein
VIPGSPDSAPAEFHLAILGGCMSHQPGIPFNALYHRQLGRQVQATTGIRIRPHVARGFGRDFGSRLDALGERFELDGVLLHLRVLVTKRARLFVRVGTAKDSHWRLHPALLRRGHRGPAVEELRAYENAGEDAQEDGLVRAKRHGRRRGWWLGGLSLREIGSALGAFVGLDRWAADDEVERLKEFVADCERRGLPLFILGPTPLQGQPWAGRCLRQLDDRIARFASSRGIPYALFGDERSAAGKPFIKGDGMHLTVEGHGHITHRLVQGGFLDWVRSHAATPT